MILQLNLSGSSYEDMAPAKTTFFYDLALWIFNIMLDVFFKEIRPRGSHRIPREGPVIFVVAPHVNQVSSLSSPLAV